eukprot:CAMPEP_0195012760 /NCGR_PEP_ID=MMETSP0326_2-20130528/12071_1 /TAXON_ID=2866 ORGANISM="Crypthecodinium cohnii, Strain Seligo" /NCGR_SAMPLE_ID=MMETSP0326_2 /ASSEMBLY_ACC=CAM_ASM_000348 /LENGTH=194 /DNA_ID=CAMNT_0040022529 /DNA_START=283 /DNA_END=864 /DNA_ORIENTATION=-
MGGALFWVASVELLLLVVLALFVALSPSLLLLLLLLLLSLAFLFGLAAAPRSEEVEDGGAGLVVEDRVGLAGGFEHGVALGLTETPFFGEDAGALEGEEDIGEEEEEEGAQGDADEDGDEDDETAAAEAPDSNEEETGCDPLATAFSSSVCCGFDDAAVWAAGTSVAAAVAFTVVVGLPPCMLPAVAAVAIAPA